MYNSTMTAETLIDIIRNSEQPESITNELVANVLRLINNSVNDAIKNNAFISARVDALLGDNASSAIDNFNEVLAFLKGVTDDETLAGKLNELRLMVNGVEGYADRIVEEAEGRLDERLNTLSYVVTDEHESKIDNLNDEVNGLNDRFHQFNIADIYIAANGRIVGDASYVCSGYMPLNTDFPVILFNAGVVDADVLPIALFDRNLNLVSSRSNLILQGKNWRTKTIPADAAFFAVSARKDAQPSYANSRTQEGVLHGLSLLLRRIAADLEASLQKRLKVSDDFALSQQGALSLTERAKQRLFDDLFKAAVGRYGDVDHTHVEEDGVERHYRIGELWLTYDEATVVYRLGISDYFITNGLSYGYPGRVAIQYGSTGGSNVIGFPNAYGGCKNLETLIFDSYVYLDSDYSFCWNPKLKSINGAIIPKGALVKSFQECGALEDITISQLKGDLWIADSPRLSLASVSGFVTAAKNTSLIMITVHPDVYTKLTWPENKLYNGILPAGETIAQWRQLRADAASRNISFVTTENQTISDDD